MVQHIPSLGVKAQRDTHYSSKKTLIRYSWRMKPLVSFKSRLWACAEYMFDNIGDITHPINGENELGDVTYKNNWRHLALIYLIQGTKEYLAIRDYF